MKITFLLLLVFSSTLFADTVVPVCQSSTSRYDGFEEFSKPIYFEKESEEKNFSSVVAHIPIPAEFKKAKVESVSIIYFIPSLSKAPFAWTTPDYTIEKNEVLIRFGGQPKTELEARVRVSFEGKGTNQCNSNLVSTYRFLDSIKTFRSVFD